jgi:DNA repair protein RadC
MKQSDQKVAEIEVSYNPANSNKPIIKSSQEAVKVLRAFYANETIALQEAFKVMYLNRNNRVLGVYNLSTGGIDGTVADIRLVISVALKIAAVNIILCHNHPSGNLVPSTNDKLLTHKIREACKLFDIKLLDHIILNPEGLYSSMAENGDI